MIVAQAQRDKLQQALERVSPEAAAEAAAVAEALAGGTSSEGDVVRGQLERIAELEREVKRLKQVSRCGCGSAQGGQPETEGLCRGWSVCLRSSEPRGVASTAAHSQVLHCCRMC